MVISLSPSFSGSISLRSPLNPSPINPRPNPGDHLSLFSAAAAVHLRTLSASQATSNLLPVTQTSHHSRSLVSAAFPSFPSSNDPLFDSHCNVGVIVGEGEPAERVLGRFRREVSRAGIIRECRHRRFFESTQEKKKRKSRDAARRNRKRLMLYPSTVSSIQMYLIVTMDYKGCLLSSLLVFNSFCVVILGISIGSFFPEGKGSICWHKFIISSYTLICKYVLKSQTGK